MNPLKSFSILVLLVMVSFIAAGQSDPPLRIEIDSKSDDAAYSVVTCGNSGFILFYETTRTQDDYKFWDFVCYNVFMQEIWRKDIPLNKNLKFRSKHFNGGSLYLLFHNPEKQKKELSNFQVLKLDIMNTRYELFSGELPEDSHIVDFGVFNNQIVAGINISDDKSSVIVMDMFSKVTHTAYEISDSSSRFESLYIDTLNSSYIAVFNVFLSKTDFHLLLQEFDSAGNNLSSVIIKFSENKKLNSGNVITINKNERLLIGTYDFVKGGSVDKKNYFHNESSGFYSVRIADNQPQEGRYFNFLEMENMTGYLKSKEYVQALKKAERKDQNPDKYSLDFDLLLHDIIRKDSLNYFVSEAYYEEYHTVTSTYYDYYGRPVPVSYTVFDGYKYFNAFISCFSDDGEKMWDNGLEIFNILTFDLVNRVNVFFSGDDIILAYNREGKIGAKIIKGPQIIEGVEYYPLESAHSEDKIMGDSKSNMEYWYDNYFLAYGFQNIKNN
ncbi:MAG: hypothetical protein FJY07_10060, partial [Bacteroidetes bacterium]|nr:hypothetical protein [Bacteroidota bacterium]